MWIPRIINSRQKHSVDTVVCASLFTHLYEAACTHYLNEIARVLKKGGRAVLSIHTQPAAGRVFSGTEARIDIEPNYFVRLASAAGLSPFQSPGVVYGNRYLYSRNTDLRSDSALVILE